MTIPTRATLDAFLSGTPVTLTRTADSGAQHGADRWRFAAIRLSPPRSGGTVQVSRPGKNAWAPLATFLASTLDYSARETARMAVAAYELLALAYAGQRSTRTEGYEWLVSVRCNGMVRTRRGETVPCCDMLVHPLSIRFGAGPVCRGYYARLEAQRNEKRAATDSFVERMRARLEQD